MYTHSGENYNSRFISYSQILLWLFGPSKVQNYRLPLQKCIQCLLFFLRENTLIVWVKNGQVLHILYVFTAHSCTTSEAEI